ncbi:DUF2784 domain-containing protein [Plantactinospora sp. BC1]|uniref:DUF2784 domain-containing protein n=1 Tax=Plantactinospora sp. BC1 TaxID=2108470 RepID=UPI001F1C19C6|nr:DUF2784 domain-containing protein [Plantactinospora sp. BC1]
MIVLVLALHFGFLGYLVLGGFLAWRWPRTIWLHFGAAAWGVLVTAAQLVCPLTYLEHWARRRAGESDVGRGFIDRYVEGVFYPERYALLAQALVAVLILASWLGLLGRLGVFGRFGLFGRLGLFGGRVRAARSPRPRRRLR